MQGDGDRLTAVDLSPDEHTLAFIDNDGTLSAVDTGRGAPWHPPTTPSASPEHPTRV